LISNDLFDSMFTWLDKLADTDLTPLAIVIAALMMLASRLGLWIGWLVDRRKHPGEPVRQSVIFVTGGMISLLAFLLGIAMSMAGARYDARRQTMLNEANAIGTLWLRAQMVENESGAEIQRLLRSYAQLRLDMVSGKTGQKEMPDALARVGALQNGMWTAASKLARTQPTAISALLVASLNEAIDLSATSRRDITARVPGYMLRLLLVVSLLVMGTIGYGFGLVGSRSLVITVLFIIVWTTTTVLIVDIDRPLAGKVGLDTSPLVWAIQGFDGVSAPAK
jgi:hypothetical protein